MQFASSDLRTKKYIKETMSPPNLHKVDLGARASSMRCMETCNDDICCEGVAFVTMETGTIECFLVKQDGEIDPTTVPYIQYYRKETGKYCK